MVSYSPYYMRETWTYTKCHSACINICIPIGLYSQLQYISSGRLCENTQEFDNGRGETYLILVDHSRHTDNEYNFVVKMKYKKQKV